MGAASSSSNVKVKFGDGEYIYFHEDADDHLTIYSKKGIDFTSQSNTGTFTVNGTEIGVDSGNSVKMVCGTFTSSSNKTVNVGFQPYMVIFASETSTGYFGRIGRNYAYGATFGSSTNYDSNSKTTSTGFTIGSGMHSKWGSVTVSYAAFG